MIIVGMFGAARFSRGAAVDKILGIVDRFAARAREPIRSLQFEAPQRDESARADVVGLDGY
jgi:hypothetical protein